MYRTQWPPADLACFTGSGLENGRFKTFDKRATLNWRGSGIVGRQATWEYPAWEDLARKDLAWQEPVSETPAWEEPAWQTPAWETLYAEGVSASSPGLSRSDYPG